MISPLTRLALIACGVALAGVPLLFFTAPAPEAAPAASAAPEQAHPLTDTPAQLRYTGHPTSIALYHEGRLLCRLSPPLPQHSWQGKLPLPQPEAGAPLELEAEAHWQEPQPQPQVITLELSPPHLPTRHDTQWTTPGEATLHSIFSFTW